MTLEEKLAQLVGFWVDQGDEVVAPMAGEMATVDAATRRRPRTASATSPGSTARVRSTRSSAPSGCGPSSGGCRRETRLGIPAIVHEECLTGLAAWKAATFPTPLAWGAAFDPDARGARWARSSAPRCASSASTRAWLPCSTSFATRGGGGSTSASREDPYVVGTIGTAYVRGLQGAGVHATLKHFVGYSASRAGRNHAPVHAGPREIADVLLPPSRWHSVTAARAAS